MSGKEWDEAEILRGRKRRKSEIEISWQNGKICNNDGFEVREIAENERAGTIIANDTLAA